MAYDFPASPLENQEYTPPGGVTYVFISPRWVVKTIPLPTAGSDVPEAPLDGKQYGRQSAAWTEVVANPTWSTLSGKPATFPPDAHTHAYSSLTGIPSTFAPATHSHAQSEVTGLVTDLSGKAPVVHTHAQADVTGLVTALAGKEPVISGGTDTQFWRGDKTWATPSGGDWASITGKPSTFPPSVHGHAISEITNLQTTLDGKAALAHTHIQGDITNLVADLAAKAPLASPALTGNPTAPTAAPGDDDTTIATTAFVTAAVVAGGSVSPSNTVPLVSGTPSPGSSALYSRGDHIHPTDTTRAAVSHTHPQSEVTNLVTDLAGKAPTAHTHLWAHITDKPETFTPTAHTHVWADITDKPTTFVPSTHVHTQSDITNLTTDLSARVLKAGDTMTGKLTVPNSTAAAAGINIGASTGTVITSPVDGDLWINNLTLNYRGVSTTYSVATLNSGQTFTGAKTFSAKVTFGTASTSGSINLPQASSAPSVPSNGDIWTQTAGLYAYISGSTKGPFIDASALTGKADINSPIFTGNPQAPTPSPGDNDLSIATTAFVTAAVAAGAGSGSYLPLAGGTLTGVLKVANGTSVAPGLAFVPEENTGWYMPGLGALRAVAQGVDVFQSAVGGNTSFVPLTISSDTFATLEFDSTTRVSPLGHVRFWFDGATFSFQNALTADFATYENIFQIRPENNGGSGTLNIFKQMSLGGVPFTGSPTTFKMDTITPGIWFRDKTPVTPLNILLTGGEGKFKFATADAAGAITTEHFLIDPIVGSVESNLPLHINGATSDLYFNETDQTDPAGRYRFNATGGGFYLQKSAGAAWASYSDIFYLSSGGVFEFRTPITFATSATINSAVKMLYATPELQFNETDQTDPLGRYRFSGQSGTFYFQKANLANWAASVNVFSYNGPTNVFEFISTTVVNFAGAVTFNSTIAANTPTISSTTPGLRFAETDTGNAGQFAFYVSASDFILARYTGAAFTTPSSLMTFDYSDSSFYIPFICKLATTGGQVEIGSTTLSQIIYKRVGQNIITIPTGGTLRIQDTAATPLAWANISSATGWAAGTSDARLKENITPIRYGLETVLALNPVEFDWIADGRHDIGLVAQEVEPIIPEIVEVWEADSNIEGQIDTYAMRKDALVAVLIKALQEMYVRLVALEEAKAA